MTKFDLSQIKPIPGFDSKKWLRKRHVEMQRETEGMTSEEICEYFRLASERAELRRKAHARLQEAKAESADIDN
jgi:hypothetical protein